MKSLIFHSNVYKVNSHLELVRITAGETHTFPFIIIQVIGQVGV